MSVWYFTFCLGQTMGGWCQPIKAPTYGAARAKMFELYGDKWCFQYSEEDWNRWKNDPHRMWPMERELELIEVQDE